MKAIVCRGYGSPDLLALEEIGKPAPGEAEVLIAVRAASLNAMDWHLMRGTPALLRLGLGLRRPKSERVGHDFAGIVAAVGAGATRFAPGDAVFGARPGAFAELVCAPETSLAPKPAGLSFEQAAALPVAGLTALQGLRLGRLKAGDEVLVNGAAGGVGSLAVSIARAHGAAVTGVCSAAKADFVRSLGADRIIAYDHEDFTAGRERYDLIFDLVANHPVRAVRRLLAPGGRIVAAGVGRSDGRGFGGWAARLIGALIASRFTGRWFAVAMSKMDQGDLAELAELAESGRIRPAIDVRRGLEAVPAAMAELATGHVRGKIVIGLDGRTGRLARRGS